MYTLKDIREELKIKERSVSDLIRYIKTRTDDNPNYSLLLGAGCSVTSNIRSANELIKQWKEEICKSEHGDELFNIDIDVEINNATWFNSRNPYSSLFEKRYDLPRQRRMFVEQEVRDKIPSIGYAYLTKIVETNYFKTIFTTNFDDLLNEAFYQYSTHRPIVCAHDSAINSITVTSKRAKIVKLHGDYLFDDIKSTLRETESLEENIKNKFIEFAKDYGLIVIGYGGNDRSIVDVITYLLKNEEYFKHGIYWCLRDDSEINDDLKKLLWKDRVFYVRIEGFDELFAELNANLNAASLPVDSNFLNDRKREILKQLTTNPFLQSTKSKYLNEDFKKIKKTLEQDVVESFIKFITEKDNDEEDKTSDFEKKGIEYELTKKEELIFANIQSDFIQEDFSNALITIREHIKYAKSGTAFYRGLLERKAKCSRLMDENDAAKDCYEELIKIYGDNPIYYISLSRVLVDKKEKITILDKGLKRFKFIAKLYFEKARILYNIYDNAIYKADLDFGVSDLIALLDKCLELDPSIDNDYWGMKFNLIDNDKGEDSLHELESIVSFYEKQDIHHPNLVTKKVHLMNLKKTDKEKIYEYIKTAICESENPKYIKYHELTLLKQYSKNNDLDLISKRFIHIESNFKVDADYLKLKAEITFNNLRNLPAAIQILESIKRKDSNINRTLCNYYLYACEIDKAKLIIETEFPTDYNLKCELLASEKKYKEALELTQKERINNEFDEDLIIQESYYLLKMEKYGDAENLSFKYLNKTSYKNPILFINYSLAQKKAKKQIKREKIKEKLIESKPESIHIAAGYAILDDKENALKQLAKAIKEDYSLKYRILDWVLFEDFRSDPKFTDIVY